MFVKDALNVYRAEALARLGWVEHGFGTRASDGWFPRERLATLKQIHSNIAVIPEAPGLYLGEGDALVTDRPGLLVGVRTADCLPILMADCRRRVVAAVHAGWRGTVREVVCAALETMRSRYGTQAEDVEVAIGPGIGECHYEVGPEVAAQLAKYFPERTDLDRATRVDLAEANRRQLIAAGVPPSQVTSGGPCTYCLPAEFHSWRRDGAKCGRMLSIIGVRE